MHVADVVHGPGGTVGAGQITGEPYPAAAATTTEPAALLAVDLAHVAALTRKERVRQRIRYSQAVACKGLALFNPCVRQPLDGS